MTHGTSGYRISRLSAANISKLERLKSFHNYVPHSTLEVGKLKIGAKTKLVVLILKPVPLWTFWGFWVRKLCGCKNQ